MKLKKLMTGVLAAFMLAGCAPKQQQNPTKLKIVATTFPQYDWIREIIGKDNTNVDLQLLMKNGGDLHSYQPTAGDIANIADANLFVYVGGESDEWVDDALEEKTNKDMKVINMMQTLGDDIDEEEEGLEDHDHDHDHDDKDHDHDHDSEEAEYDEHVWLSLKNAQKLVMDIEADIESLDPDNASDYAANAEAYVKKIAELDSEYQKVVDESNTKYILVGDRFPFRYLVDDYNIKYSAAFVGCSAETEASFDTVTFLAGKLDELGLKNVITIENSDQKIAKTVIENTKNKDQGLVVLNSLQSVSQKDIDSGLTYLSVMKDNLEVLKKALAN